MPVKVHCPNCSKELNSPDELIGQFVACPRCGRKFQVTGGPSAQPAGVGAQPIPTVAPTTPPSPSAVPATPPSASSPTANMLPPAATPCDPPSQELPPPPPSGGADSSTANLERLSLDSVPTAPPHVANNPPTAVPKPESREAASPSGPRTARPFEPAKPGASEPPVEMNNTREPPAATPTSQPPGQSVAKFKGPPPASNTPAAKPAKKRREVKKAKFVASGPVTTKFNLGEDGQLPNLVVADTKETTESEDAEKSTSPVLMIAVLIFSVVVSLVMLLAPEGAKESESMSKQQSIQHIQEHYIGTGSNLKRYQILLREGIQAERRGDEQEARSAFREVLRMLRAEPRGKDEEERGLTSKFRDVQAVPNDHDLENHLNVLLADD